MESETLQKAEIGVDLRRLQPGTKVILDTLNSTYVIEVISDKEQVIQGGSFLPKPHKAMILGSTEGDHGGLVREGWIGRDMALVFFYFKDSKGWDRISTSAVQRAKIIGRTYEYELEW